MSEIIVEDYILDADYEKGIDKVSKSLKDMGELVQRHEKIDLALAKHIGKVSY